jgi:hypothetical protein
MKRKRKTHLNGWFGLMVWVPPKTAQTISSPTGALVGAGSLRPIFTAPTCTTIIIPLKPCALNAEIQHFILRFNKISLLCRYHLKRVGEGKVKTG